MYLRRTIFLAVLTALPVLAIRIVSAEGAEDSVIPATEANKHVGEVCTVEFVVKSTGTSRKDKLLFLNSTENFRIENNFAVVFEPNVIDKFKAAGIQDIERYYFGKRIRVTGMLRHFKSMTDVRVDNPEHIRIVEPSRPEPTLGGREPSPAEVSAPAPSPSESPRPAPFLYGTPIYYLIGAGLALLVVGYLVGRLKKAR